MNSATANALAAKLAEAKDVVDEARGAVNAETGGNNTEADRLADDALSALGRLDDLVGDHVTV